MVRFGQTSILSPGTLHQALKIRIFTDRVVTSAAPLVWLARTLCKKHESDPTLQCRDIKENVLAPQARLSNQVTFKPVTAVDIR